MMYGQCKGVVWNNHLIRTNHLISGKAFNDDLKTFSQTTKCYKGLLRFLTPLACPEIGMRFGAMRRTKHVPKNGTARRYSAPKTCKKTSIPPKQG